MPQILLASDADWIREELRSILADKNTAFVEIDRGQDTLRVAKANELDLAIFDLQIGNMGGIASCLELRLEESGGRLPHIPVLLLLDRRADVFLARRSNAEGWIVKPFDALRLHRAVRTILRGEEYHDDTYKPDPVLVTDKK